MIELRTPGELDAMRAAGAVVADMHAAVRALAAPGVRLTQLDAVARDVLAGAGATSTFEGYAPLPTTPPFPGVVCLSVNDVALHGIPIPERAGWSAVVRSPRTARWRRRRRGRHGPRRRAG